MCTWRSTSATVWGVPYWLSAGGDAARCRFRGRVFDYSISGLFNWSACSLLTPAGNRGYPWRGPLRVKHGSPCLQIAGPKKEGRHGPSTRRRTRR